MNNTATFKIVFGIALVLFACKNKTESGDIIEQTKRQIAKENVPFTMPDTTAPANWPIVNIETSLGNIRVALNPNTPKHTDNFLKLVQNNYYSNILFHRIIDGFMVQAGDPKSKTATKNQPLGDGGPGYTLSSEISDTFYHFKGALAAAREADERNPMRNSSGSQFYIVTGTPTTLEKQKEIIEQKEIKAFLKDEKNKEYSLRLNAQMEIGNQAAVNQVISEIKPQIENQTKSTFDKIPQKVKNIYATWGGAPFLDNNYTVFGMTLSGFDVIDKIQKIERDENDRPLQDVKIIKCTVIKGK